MDVDDAIDRDAATDVHPLATEIGREPDRRSPTSDSAPSRLRSENALDIRPAASDVVIEARGLTFTYATATAPAVDGLDFEIPEGEIFGFLGPSGAGKSTTQKILIGLLREYDGQATVFGTDLRAWGPDYYERVGVSFEQPNHYLKLTAHENLAYFASLYAGETESPDDVLESLGLSEHRDMRVGEFSKGMRNRLNIARSLLNKPELLFLDEPTAGLDPVNAQRVKDIIEERRRGGTTVFLTTHDMWAADQLCDRVAFIIDGKIPLIDSPRNLKLQHGRRAVRVEYVAPGADAAGREDFDLADLADNQRFLDVLRHSHIETIHTLEATLEDVFIEVTGQTLA